MFFTLNDYYFNYEKTDELGNFLSSMNPGNVVEENTDSADSAYYYDWNNILNEKSSSNILNENEAFEAMIYFLEYYSKRFKLAPKEVVDYFKMERMDSPEWKRAVEKVKVQLADKESASRNCI